MSGKISLWQRPKVVSIMKKQSEGRKKPQIRCLPMLRSAAACKPDYLDSCCSLNLFSFCYTPEVR